MTSFISILTEMLSDAVLSHESLTSSRRATDRAEKFVRKEGRLFSRCGRSAPNQNFCKTEKYITSPSIKCELRENLGKKWPVTSHETSSTVQLFLSCGFCHVLVVLAREKKTKTQTRY